MLGLNVDFRNADGYPSIDLVRQLQPAFVRCVSHPDQENGAFGYHIAGIPIVAVFTGESWDAGKYVMQHCTAVQGMNEPLEGGHATWPGTVVLQEIEDIWLQIRDAVWQRHGDWFPLIGPGLAYTRSDLWHQLRWRLQGVTAAACHVYPMATGHSLTTIKAKLREFRDVAPELPLICTEWDSEYPDHLRTYDAIRTYCRQAAHFNWHNVPQHAMWGNEKLGVLRWVA